MQMQEDKKARIRKFDVRMIDTIDLLIDFLRRGIETNGKEGS